MPSRSTGNVKPCALSLSVLLVALPSPRPQPAADGGFPIESEARALLAAGDFDGARRLWCELSERSDAHAPQASAEFAYLRAIGWGELESAAEHLTRLRQEEDGTLASLLLARIRSLQGQHAQALEILAEHAPSAEWVRASETVLALAPRSDVSGDLSRRVLLHEPWNLVASAVLLEVALARRDFEEARRAWRALQLVDYFGGALGDDRTREVESVMGLALESEGELLELAQWLADCGHPGPANSLLGEDGGSPQFEALRQRLLASLELRASLCSMWCEAIGAGLAGGKAAERLRRNATSMARAGGWDSVTALYAGLRDEQRLHLLFLSSDPLSLGTDASLVMADEWRAVPEPLGEGFARRILTGASLFRMTWLLEPLLGASGSKGFHRPDWPRCMVLRPELAIAEAAEHWRVLTGFASDPSSALPVMIPADAASGVLVSAYGVGNQGGPCLWRARAAGLGQTLSEVLLGGSRERTLRTGFLSVMARGELAAMELHELRHVRDAGAEEDFDRATREERAFLTELLLAPAPERYDRLALVATGGTPDADDPYEQANYRLLHGYVATLKRNPALAPALDYGKSLQAQLHNLTPSEIALIAGRLLERPE